MTFPKPLPDEFCGLVGCARCLCEVRCIHTRDRVWLVCSHCCLRKSEAGKILYVPVIEFVDKGTRDAISARVIAALLAFEPSAFAVSAA
jgi:hypothetical protein